MLEKMKPKTYEEFSSEKERREIGKKIVVAKGELNIGQHWHIKEPSDKLPVYPTDILILAVEDFSMGGVVTICLGPPKLKGKHFPARADVILDNYSLVYDPYEGYVWPFKEDDSDDNTATETK